MLNLWSSCFCTGYAQSWHVSCLCAGVSAWLASRDVTCHIHGAGKSFEDDDVELICTKSGLDNLQALTDALAATDSSDKQQSLLQVRPGFGWLFSWSAQFCYAVHVTSLHVCAA